MEGEQNKESDRLDAALVRRMGWYSFLCAYLVPGVHLSRFSIHHGDFQLLTRALNFWDRGVCRIAVEAFFVLSGYLFFRTYRADGSNYLPKLRRRVRTLLIPYLFWVIVGSAGELVKGEPFLGVRSVLAWLGLAGEFPSILSLWYIRNLLVLCVASPLVYLLMRRRRLGLVALVGLLVLQWVALPWYLQPIPNAFWFGLGAYLVLHHVSLVQRQVRRPWLWLALWLLGVALSQAVLVSRGLSWELMEPVYALTGILVVWGIAGVLNAPALLRHVAPHTFLIFAAHGLAVQVLSAAWFFAFPATDMWLTLGYFITQALVVASCVAAGEIAARVVPRFYGLVTGGRGLRAVPARGRNAHSN